MGAAILTSLTHQYCVNNNKIWFVAKKIKVVMKVMHQENIYGAKKYIIVSEQKLVSVIFE